MLTQLYRVMRWCASRQVIVELASGTYRTSLSPVDLQQFVRSIEEDKGRAQLSVVDETVGLGKVHFDEAMAWVVLENAMSNALKHGDGNVHLAVKFDPGTNAISFTIKNQVQTEHVRSLSSKCPPSTHCGLRHAALACQGAGGTSRLEFSENLNVRTAVFTVSMPAAISSLVPDGASSLENSPKLKLPGMLKICAIDDSCVICKGIDRVLFKTLEADRKTSVVCCPENEADVAAFMDQIFAPPSSAAIVLLDQNIELKSGIPRVLGTTLADELRLRRYEGLVVIRSANAAASDDEEYMRSGSVDACIGKHETLQGSVELIANAFNSKKRAKCGVMRESASNKIKTS